LPILNIVNILVTFDAELFSNGTLGREVPEEEEVNLPLSLSINRIQNLVLPTAVYCDKIVII